VGGRLPTEAEWEYAARRTSSPSWQFVTGSEIPNCSQGYTQPCAALSANPQLPQRGGSATEDRSPDGIYDLTGNVMEWTSSRYGYFGYCENGKSLEQQCSESSDAGCVQNTCDASSDRCSTMKCDSQEIQATPICLLESTPTAVFENGDMAAGKRVVRGGSFAQGKCLGTVYHRRGISENDAGTNLGFRCARDVTLR
jgi:formylglycine-generating enzyme required for sulfatase activity